MSANSAARRRRGPSLAEDARGATTVEFGLVSGVLFLILFAITDFGFAFWQWSAASKALQLVLSARNDGLRCPHHRRGP